MQRATVLATADVLLPKDIPLGQSSLTIESAPVPSAGADSLEDAVETLFGAATNGNLPLLPWLEREFTLRAMSKTGNNQVRAARLLGITRATLRKRWNETGPWLALTKSEPGFLLAVSGG